MARTLYINKKPNSWEFIVDDNGTEYKVNQPGNLRFAPVYNAAGDIQRLDVRTSDFLPIAGGELNPLNILTSAGAAYWDGGVILDGSAIAAPESTIFDDLMDVNEQIIVLSAAESEFALDVALGNISGKESYDKYGALLGFADTDGEVIVWDGGNGYSFLTSAVKLDVASLDPLDTILGTGARKIIIYGLDAAGLDIQEEVEMDGTNTVTTSLDFYRVKRVRVTEDGNGNPINGSNLGTIDIVATGTSNLLARVLPGNGSTLMAIGATPANKQLFAYELTISAASQGAASKTIPVEIKGKMRDRATPNAAWQTRFDEVLLNAVSPLKYKIPFQVPANYDYVFTVQALDTGTAACSVQINGVLIDIT